MENHGWRSARLLGRWILLKHSCHRGWAEAAYILCCKATAIAVLITGFEEFLDLGLRRLKLYVYASYPVLLVSATTIYYVSARRTLFMYRYAGFCSLIRPIMATLEIFACNRILWSIHRNSYKLCWMFVAGSAYLTFATNILVPSYDFLLPPLLAQLAMNKAIFMPSVFFRVKIYVACIAIFLVRHLLEVEGRNIFRDRLNLHHEEPLGPEWRTFWRFFVIRDPIPVMGWVETFWLLASFGSGVGLVISRYHMGGIPYQVTYVEILLLFPLTYILYYITHRVPRFECRYFVMSAVLQSISEGVEVLIVAIILNNIKNHSVATCWFYTSLSALAVVVMKTICPTYNFLIPVALAEVALNEVLTDQIEDKGLVFKLGIYCACYIIFAILEGMERRVLQNCWRDRLVLENEKEVRRITRLFDRCNNNENIV